MCSDLECGICYLVFNAGLRCPRRLRCGHSFCENCLQILARPQNHNQNHRTETDPTRAIVCPLCRYTTPIPGVGGVRAALRVDECVLEQLVETRVLFLDPEGDSGDEQDQCQDQDQEGPDPQSSSEDGDSSAVTSGGRIRRSWIRVWRKISGKSARRGRMDVTSDDMRNFALMAAYMF
ncbi:RING finger protein 227 [Sphaeramia orbicularis]|uniref:RING-type domain-containing protein n=1 Tax=Sphaeramia orbicularis TaxID=375764 RepID=A0A673CSA5_9TELE|nr:RING finger protein 227 [Sphaeramia orbicularis]